MRRRVLFFGGILFLALALPVHAQQFTSALQGPSGGPFSSFFGQTMAKPNFSAMSVKPSMPGPLNLGSMLPSFPNLGNTMLLRNMFSGPQATFQMPKTQAPPPPKKK